MVSVSHVDVPAYAAPDELERTAVSRGEDKFYDCQMVASLDRKRLGTKVSRKTSWTRGVFDEEASRKPLAFAADAVSYGI